MNHLLSYNDVRKCIKNKCAIILHFKIFSKWKFPSMYSVSILKETAARWVLKYKYEIHDEHKNTIARILSIVTRKQVTLTLPKWS